VTCTKIVDPKKVPNCADCEKSENLKSETAQVEALYSRVDQQAANKVESRNQQQDQTIHQDADQLASLDNEEHQLLTESNKDTFILQAMDSDPSLVIPVPSTPAVSLIQQESDDKEAVHRHQHQRHVPKKSGHHATEHKQSAKAMRSKLSAARHRELDPR
jgi:vacuolar-type H+-ATPase subunit I/STV1